MQVNRLRRVVIKNFGTKYKSCVAEVGLHLGPYKIESSNIQYVIHVNMNNLLIFHITIKYNFRLQNRQ